MTRTSSRSEGTNATTFRIGADENGLGPLLGPLVVTAVLAELDARGERHVERPARGALLGRLGDSKALVAHGDVALGEAWARALAERGCLRHEAATIEDLVLGLSLDDRAELRRPCPAHVAPQCWGEEGEAFFAPDALVATIHRDLDAMARRGVRLVAVRSVIVCTERLNALQARGTNRFHVDLHAMERLVLALREQAGADVLAVCGKVGGLGHYERAFGPLGGRLFTILEESRARSAYAFPGVGELRFVQDADGSDRLVSIASLVGKYLREVLMARIVRHYRATLPELPDASGYHDPVTAAFVDGTALLRKKRRVPAGCFEREAAPRPAKKAERSG